MIIIKRLELKSNQPELNISKSILALFGVKSSNLVNLTKLRATTFRKYKTVVNIPVCLINLGSVCAHSQPSPVMRIFVNYHTVNLVTLIGNS